LKLYFDKLAPNSRRVEMFVAEKGLEIPRVEISIADGHHRKSDFLAKNPLSQVPVLEIENDLYIAESMAICRYLEERFPTPILFGRDIEERAVVHMWSRRVEAMLFVPAVEYGHHSHPSFRGRFDRIPAYAQLCHDSIQRSYSLLDSRLSSVDYLGSQDAFSIADLVAFCGLELARLWRVPPAPSLTSLARWYQRVSERSSARIARYV
jgi:glutathione S-transferase